MQLLKKARNVARSMHDYDHSASGERKHLFAREPSALQLLYKHYLQQHADTATLETEQTRIGTDAHAASTDIEHMRIKSHAASIVTAGRCPPIEHPTQVAALHAGGPSHCPGRCARCAGDRRSHASGPKGCDASIAAIIRHHPERWQGPPSALERPSRPPRPLF